MKTLRLIAAFSFGAMFALVINSFVLYLTSSRQEDTLLTTYVYANQQVQIYAQQVTVSQADCQRHRYLTHRPPLVDGQTTWVITTCESKSEFERRVRRDFSATENVSSQ
jgi:hypothetical protein